MNTDFFRGFTADLHNESAWKEFHSNFRNGKKKLKDTVNPTQLGDHVSLKAEAADSQPTGQDRGAASSGKKEDQKPLSSSQETGRPSLSKLAKDTTIGDPISLESEDVVESSRDNNSNLDHTAESKEPVISFSSSKDSSSSLPPIPSIDGEKLFWSMMSTSREPDPYVFPALQRLSKQKSRPILGALSNTVIYPPGHPWSKESGQSAASTASASNKFLFSPRTFFEVYVASAEVGMRKPSRDIYEVAIKRLDEFDREQGGSGITAKDIIFLDDIGENLKMGKTVGMRTIKVQLGKTWRAVKELEEELGMELMDERTRRSKL